MIIIIILLIFFFYRYKKNNLLIENGNIMFKNLNDNYNLEDLMRDLIKKRITDINEIDKAYSIFGNLKIIMNKPYILIANGKIDYDTLLKSKKGMKFIYKLLKDKSIKLNEVLYAIYLNDRFYVVKL